MSKKPSVDMFYDIRTGKYPLKIGTRFVPLSSGDAELHLRATGISNKDYTADGFKETEKAFLVCQQERSVDFSAPLSGHAVGPFLTPDGRRVLVTSSPTLPQAKRGAWPAFRSVLNQLLGNQQDRFVGWLKASLVSLERRDFRPGQLLVFAGEPNCGKSFLQWCITQCFGGRSADPLLWLRGETKFNDELAIAEHWCIEDPGSATRADVRRNFGDAIKRAVINRDLMIHGKGKAGITLPIWRRLTLSVNGEAENVSALPPLDDSMKDKIMLFKCGIAELSEDRLENAEMFKSELPAFLHYVKSFEVDKKLRCQRMGVQSWHHPELIDALTSLSPEQHLIELIDEVVFQNANQLTPPWIGSAERLKQDLLKSEFRFTVEKLLYYSSACGVFLARLENKMPHRVSSARHDGKTRWTINPVAS